MTPVLILIIILLVALLLAVRNQPARALLAKGRPRPEQERIRVEDALKYLYFCERERIVPSLAAIAGRVQITENEAAELLQQLQAHGFVTVGTEAMALTGDGRAYALHVVRAHRLWERHLADETGYAAHEWHSRAEEAEHRLTPAQADALASRLNNPLLDPHGDPIPTATGEMMGESGPPVTALGAGEYGEIIHLEDEPDHLYAHLVALGFYPGMQVQLLEQSADRVRLWADGDEYLLAPLFAAQITVKPIAASEVVGWAEERAVTTLADLQPQTSGRIIALSPRCRGVERRRFLDLGFVPGTAISAEMVSPSGEPTAYRVRDTLIALRKSQAQLILIER